MNAPSEGPDSYGAKSIEKCCTDTFNQVILKVFDELGKKHRITDHGHIMCHAQRTFSIADSTYLHSFLLYYYLRPSQPYPSSVSFPSCCVSAL